MIAPWLRRPECKGNYDQYNLLGDGHTDIRETSRFTLIFNSHKESLSCDSCFTRLSFSPPSLWPSCSVFPSTQSSSQQSSPTFCTTAFMTVEVPKLQNWLLLYLLTLWLNLDASHLHDNCSVSQSHQAALPPWGKYPWSSELGPLGAGFSPPPFSHPAALPCAPGPVTLLPKACPQNSQRVLLSVRKRERGISVGCQKLSVRKALTTGQRQHAPNLRRLSSIIIPMFLAHPFHCLASQWSLPNKEVLSEMVCLWKPVSECQQHISSRTWNGQAACEGPLQAVLKTIWSNYGQHSWLLRGAVATISTVAWYHPGRLGRLLCTVKLRRCANMVMLLMTQN